MAASCAYCFGGTMSAEAIAIGNATTTIVARINLSYRRRFAMTACGRSQSNAGLSPVAGIVHEAVLTQDALHRYRPVAAFRDACRRPPPIEIGFRVPYSPDAAVP